jgi:hypothetical protein
MDSKGRQWKCKRKEGRKEGEEKRLTKEIFKGIRKKEVSGRGR